MNTLTYHEIIQRVIRFKFKKFQLEDYARAALHDGVILGHDTGGGKTIALYVLPALKVGFRRPVEGPKELRVESRATLNPQPSTLNSLQPLKPVLIVAPGDLHAQIIKEGMDHFRAQVTSIDSQAAFTALTQPNPAGSAPIVPPGYYITSYTQLASNGVREFPKHDPANWLGLMQTLGLSEKDGAEFFESRGGIYAKLYRRLNAQPHFSALMLKEAWQMAKKACGQAMKLIRELDADYAILKNFHPARGQEFNDLDDDQQKFVLGEMVRHCHTEYSASIGSHRWYKHTPPVPLPEGVKRTEGRMGEVNEFVEIECPDPADSQIGRERRTVRYVAQKSKVPDRPAEWVTYIGKTDNFDVDKTYQSRQEAVDRIEELAKLPKAQVQEFKVKCVYDPSLADLCQDSFAAVAVDEGVKMKGEDTEVGLGVRQMNSPYKFVLSATPIKNRLPDVFRLAWWATGAKSEVHARFPYPDSARAREEFAQEFLISERNLTKEEDKGRRFKKLTPQVCNIHLLWKLFAPIILRRRKKDFGEDIVQKTRHVVRAPMGAEQAKVYKFHLDAKYLDKNGLPAIGAQLQALRIAAANPCSGLLARPAGDGKTEGPPRSTQHHIPKLHAAFKLITQILERGEQVVVFSAFHDSLDALADRLQEAGVKHCVLDGRTSQARRGAISAQFKLGPPKAGGKVSPFPVMLAGVECMAEGHSWELCNNVILLCYSWAYDKFEQGINRVHRLNSRWDVNVYPIICEGSIDRKLEALIQEKGDAAELVLDGKLLAEHSAEVNLAELLHVARTEFNGLAVVDEKELAKDWPALRAGLAQAQKNWTKPWLAARQAVEVIDISTVSVTSAPASVAEPVEQVNLQPTAKVRVIPPSASAVKAQVKLEEMELWAQVTRLPQRPSPFARLQTN